MLSRLFSPFSIRGLKLKNRIVMPPMGVFLVDEEGFVTDDTLAYYRRRARGGAGMIMVEASAVAPEGIVSHHQMRIYDDAYIPGLRRIAEVIKEGGARAAIQIHHAGRQTSSRVIGRPPLAPSPLKCPTIRGEVEVLTTEAIARIVKQFGDAAERAVEAGFEMVEIHGAHGYLINQFLSRFSNIREDEYGGPTENRARFALEVVQEIRRRLGPHFPISFKISAQEFVPEGLTVEECIRILQLLEETGIDVVQVSAGTDATPEWISQPMFMKRGCLVESASQIKRALHIPVICVGRINGPMLAEQILREGKADLVCMGRALLADPDLPNKAKEGRLHEIRRCVACNTCINSIFKKGRVECLVNPEVSRESAMQLQPAKRTKRVVVIGGGPAGCEAAWVAASRGHRVKVYESHFELGGQILLGAVPSHKKDLLNIVRFHHHQLQKYHVECLLGRKATLEDILKENPDIVILATGARPHLPLPEKVLPASKAVTFSAVLNGDSPSVPQEVAVVGGGAIGCEVALYLAENGHTVTIFEMTDSIGTQFEAMTKKIVLQKIRDLGIRVLTNARITGFRGNDLQFEQNGSFHARTFPFVVFATGTIPDDRLYGPLKARGLEVARIGDCVKPRSIKEAIYEGAMIGRSI